ncbi:MAG TPA: cysteine synthase family protein [Acidobacteriota bacterium]|nr:cysteine synthase family protein [Acidobacteriota bacterium]HQO19799.1 cysteine synthase family protein [Acidobacteriota bacterium]HQQ46628.1 cysteine synthase family protein [Acidobacteriota bacterium]
MPPVRQHDSVLDAIGNTPMVKLRKITAGLACSVFAKLEFANPTGSIKDRTAKYMIQKAERDGRIKPGDTIIENSSGNMAMSLAMVAIQKGYRLKVVVRDTLSREKLKQLQALGAEIVKADTSLPPESPDSYNNITPRLARETKNCYFPDQHNNRENNEAHYSTTGPEIWEQMEGRIDCLVAGMGTGGTIGGAGKFLKEKDPKIKIIAVDVEGSVFTEYFRTGKKGNARPYFLEGLGDEFIIGCADFSVIDDMVQVSDRDAFSHARRLVKEEGLLGGGSSGAAICAVLGIAKDLPASARIATIFPDGASKYLSNIFDDSWMESRGLL